MDKRDLLIVVAAIVIVLVLAVFVKPALTGQPVAILPDEMKDLFAPKDTPTQEPFIEPTEEDVSVTASPTALITYTSAVPPTPIPTPDYTQKTGIPTPLITLLPEKSPTPRPTLVSSIEQETVPREIGRYSINGEGIHIVPRAYPGSEDTRYSFTQAPDSKVIQSYSGKYSTVTSPIEIDSNYFIISYTADVPEFLQNAEPGGGESDGEDAWAFEKMYSPVSTNDNDDDDNEDGYESYSVNNPHFSITIINADTGEVVQTITQTNLDSRMWAGIFGDAEDADDDEKYEDINWDPRPWTENIFAGKGEYLFDIQTNALNSYRVDILVPVPEPVKKDTERLLLALFIQRELRNLLSLFEREDPAPAYDYFTAIATEHITDEEMAAAIAQQIQDLKPTRGVVSGFTITDAELYGESPTLSGTLTIDDIVSGGSEERNDKLISWKIEINSIPAAGSKYRGTVTWEVDGEVHQTAWEHPTKVIQLILQLENEYRNAYANEAGLFQDTELLETYSSDLMLLSAAQDQGVDISSGVVPVYPDPYLIPLDIHKFITLYNADNYETIAYGENISEALSKRINDGYTLDEIYQYFLAMRYAGIVIQDFKIYSVDIRDSEASVRGEFIWKKREETERRTPCEIIVVFEWTKPDQYTMWKIDTLPPLRY